jgi:hypothetical protein
MKPASIVAFGRLWLLSILLSLAGAWITRQRVQAMLEANPQSAPIAHWALPAWAVLATAVSLILWLLIQRRSLTAKWMVLLIAILSTGRGLVTLFNLIGAEHLHPLSSLVMLACSAATVAAAAQLMRPDARLWFGEDGVDHLVGDDPEAGDLDGRA